jgi:hypothetical protein
MKSSLPTDIAQTLNLPPALGGERVHFGGLNCYVTGHVPPLVLVHSVNGAPSATKMRPLHEHCSATRTVFAIDLPGFEVPLAFFKDFDAFLAGKASSRITNAAAWVGQQPAPA